MELYLHIPFCAKKCEYCSFVSYPAGKEQKDRYIEALIREASLRREEFTEPVTTVFIGGGTPSLLMAEQLKKLVNSLNKIVPLHACREFTVEANPGTLKEPFLKTAADLGINRLSLGMQAEQDRLLQLLGRIHTFREVCESVELARKLCFDNINLDLIFGIPGQTMEDWEKTLDAALSLCPEHISAYGLIPEEGTPLYERLRTHELELPDQEIERCMYDMAIEKLSKNGLNQYEISNFAKNGYECVHNIGYWMQVPYTGLGVSAASMRIIEHTDGGMKCLRRTNPADPEKYICMTEKTDSGLIEIEEIGPEEARFETMMLALRMNQGINEERFRKLHGVSLTECYGSELEKMKEQGFMQHRDGNWSLTRKGMDLQNTVLLEFMKETT